jgi:hypothetical protein
LLQAKANRTKVKAKGRMASRTDRKDVGILAKEKFAHKEPLASSLGSMVLHFPYLLYSWPRLPLVQNRNRRLRERCCAEIISLKQRRLFCYDEYAARMSCL